MTIGKYPLLFQIDQDVNSMCVAVWPGEFYKFEDNEIIEYSEGFLSIELWLPLQVLGTFPYALCNLMFTCTNKLLVKGQIKKKNL